MRRALPLLVFLALSPSLLAQAAAPRRPNIVFIMTDDHATAAMSCYGSRINRTPQLDRLARDGMRFDRAYCTNSICAPSRAVILTGKYSHVNGVLDNGQRFDGSQVTLPKLLGAVGYTTAMIGKWHLKTTPTGFDHYCVLPGQGSYINPDFLENGERIRVEGYVTDIITDESIRWLRRRPRDKPFLLMMQHKAPHRNWISSRRHTGLFEHEDVPEPDTLFDDYEGRRAAKEQEMTIARHFRMVEDLKYFGGGDPSGWTKQQQRMFARMTPKQREFYQATYARRDREGPPPEDPKELIRWKYQRYIKDYLRCIAAVDESIGRMLDFLDEAGLAEDTIVVYTSDQGFYLGEHGWYDKRFIYEQSARMPLIVRWPGKVPAGTENGALVSNVDFAPTLLDLAGADVPKDMQGRSFAEMVKTNEEPADWRDATYYHYYEYPGVHAVKRHYGVITKRYKLAHFYHDIDSWELYDREKDPKELRNVLDDPEYAAVVVALKKRLAELQKQYGDDPEATLSALRPKRIEHAAVGKTYKLTHAPKAQYRRNARRALTDGEIREQRGAAVGLPRSWLGFRQTPFEATVDLGEARDLKTVGLHCLHQAETWIHLPVSIDVSLSQDGREFVDAGTIKPERPDQAGSAPFTLSVDGAARYVKIRAIPVKAIPASLPGATEPAWIFVDEVIIR